MLGGLKKCVSSSAPQKFAQMAEVMILFSRDIVTFSDIKWTICLGWMEIFVYIYFAETWKSVKFRNICVRKMVNDEKYVIATIQWCMLITKTLSKLDHKTKSCLVNGLF